MWSLCEVLFMQYLANLSLVDISVEISNIKFHKIRPLGAELFSTDRYYEANSCFWQYFAKAPKEKKNLIAALVRQLLQLAFKTCGINSVCRTTYFLLLEWSDRSPW